MTTENTFQNDMFATVLLNPQANFEDFVANGYNSDNTGLLTPDEYKKLDKVQEAFTQNGVFNEEAFNNAYLTAAYRYNELAEEDLFGKLEQYVEYSPVSMYAPLEKQTTDWTPTVEKIKNPFESTYGLNALFGETETEKSRRELAQTNTHYFDWNEQKWVEESPDDFGLSGFVKPSMVYAVWQSDGFHVDQETGKTVTHQKGEWKTDKDGKFYMETVGDRESYGMEIVSSWDTLTSEGSFLNSINVFESDDKEKSIAGTTFKLFFNVLPYFIPGLNSLYGGIHMAWGLASTMPALYKSIEGIILGGDNKDYNQQTALWQFATKAENWFDKMEFSTSDEAKDSLMNYEQIGQIVGDVFSQIYEQRAAAKIAGTLLNSEQKTSKLVKELQEKYGTQAFVAQLNGTKMDDFFNVVAKNSPDLKALSEKQSKLAKQLSLGYMALTQSSEVYQQGLEAGYDRRASGITALFALAGQYTLMMNNSLGDWFLDKTTGYVKNSLNKEINKGLMELIPQVQKQVVAIDKAAHSAAKIEAKKGLVSSLIKAKDKISNLIKNGPNDYLGNAGIEAIEEMTEEAAIDLAKGFTDTLSWLGVWRKNGDFFDKGFFTQQTFERYLTSAIGGAIGGALFELNTNIISPKINGEVAKNHQRSVAELVRDGHTDEILKELDKLGSIGNTKATPIKLGDLQLSIGTPTQTNSTTQQVANALKSYVKWMDSVLNQSGLKQNNEEMVQNALITYEATRLFKESGLDKFVIEDFMNHTQKYLDVLSEFENTEEDKRSSELKKKVEEARQQATDIIEGKKAEHYMKLASLALNKNIRAGFDGMDLVNFAENYYGKEYTKLSEDEKNNAKEEHEKYLNSTNVLEYLNTRVEAFQNLEGMFSKPIKDYIDSGYIDLRKKVLNEFYDIPKTEKLQTQLINFIDFNKVQNLIDKVTPQESKFNYELELQKIQNLWVNKDASAVNELENLLYRLQGVSSEESKSEIQNEINNINNDKQIVYNLLDQLHEIEQKSKSGVFFNTYFKTNIYEQLNKALDNKFNKALETNILKINPNLSEEEKSEIKNRLIQDLNNQLLSSPMHVIQEATVDSLLKGLSLTYGKDLSTAEDEYANLEISKNSGMVSDEDYKSKKLELEKQMILFGVFSQKLSEDYFNLLKEVYVEYSKEYEKTDEQYQWEGLPETELVKVKNIFYEKSGIIVTESIDKVVTDALTELKRNIQFYWEEDEYDFEDYNNENYSVQLNLYEQAFEEYFDQLEYLDEEELSIYLDLKIPKIVSSLKPFSKFIDLKTLPKILKEVYYSGQDIKKYVLDMFEQLKKDNPEIGKDRQLDQSNLKLFTKGLDPEEKRNKIKINPMYKVLKDLQVYIGDSKINLFSLIEQLKTSLLNIKFSEFVAKNVERTAINQALKTARMLQAIVDGMIDEEVTYENPFGFNKAVINYLNKYEGGNNVEKYNLITKDQANVIRKDIKKLVSSLEASLNLSDLNSGSQLQKNKQMQENFQKVILDRFKKLGSCTIDGQDISVAIKDILNADIKDDEKLLKLENLLYDSVKLNKSNLNILLDSLKLNKEDILKKESFGLSETTIKISDYDFINWLAAILTVKSSDFRHVYLEHLKNSNEQIAPLFGQKLAIQLQYSFIKSDSKSDIYQWILDKLIDSDLEYTPNIFYTPAIGGAGKSSVIAKTTFELVKDEYDNIGISAPNTKALTKLRDSILKNNPEHVHTEINIRELLKVALRKSDNSGLTDSELDALFETDKTLESDKDNGIIKHDEYLKLKSEHGLIVRNPKDWKSKIAPIIFIDEVTNFSTPVLQALNLIAEKAKIKVIALGDDAQLGLNHHIDDLQTRGSIKLSFSMRYNNTLKGDNDKRIGYFLQQIINTKEIPKDSEYINSIKKSNFIMSYHQNESELIGDKIVKNLSGELDVFKNITSSKPEQKILIITENGILSDDLKNQLESVGIKEENYRITSIDPNSKISVQGDESDYVIVDSLDFTTKGAYYQFKKFYTSVSRSLFGTLFYDPKSNIHNTFGIVSVKKPFEPFKVFTEESIEKLKEDVIKREEELLKDFEKPVKKESSKTKTNTIKPTSKLEPKSENDSTEKGKDENDQDTDDGEAGESNNGTEEGDTEEDGNNESDESDKIKTKFIESPNLNNPKTIEEQQEEFKKSTENLIETLNGVEDELNKTGSTDFDEGNHIPGSELVEIIPSKPNNLGIEDENENQEIIKKQVDLKEELDPLWIHPFYNRIGCIIDTEGNAIPNKESNEDLNIFNSSNSEKYTEDQINYFLFFKNMLSLYTDSEIKELFLNNETSDINNKILDNLGIGIHDLQSVTFGDVYLQAKYYDSTIDDPIGVFEYSASEKLKDIDENGKKTVFVTLGREVTIDGKNYFITIGAFPQNVTLDKAVEAKKISQTTRSSYQEFENILRSELEQKPEGYSLKIGSFENVKDLMQDVTGVRVDSLENGFIDFSDFLKYKGFYYNPQSISALSDDNTSLERTGKISAVSSEAYITNIAESIVSKTVANREEEIETLKNDLRIKMTDENGKFKLRGFPVLKVFVTPKDFRYIPMYPKSRNYQQALDELQEFKNKPAAFMDSTSTFNLIWAISKYKYLFLDQLNSYVKQIEKNIALKNALTNLINFLKEIEYHDYEIFKSKYYKKFMDLKIHKGSGYYISQQVKNLESKDEMFIDVNSQGYAISVNSIIEKIKELIGSKISNEMPINSNIYYSKSSTSSDDNIYTINPDSLYSYYKISKSVQMPTLSLNLGSILQTLSSKTSKKIIRVGTTTATENENENKILPDLEIKDKDTQLEELFQNGFDIFTQNIAVLMQNLSAKDIEDLYKFHVNSSMANIANDSEVDVNDFFDTSLFEDDKEELKKFNEYVDKFKRFGFSNQQIFNIAKTFDEIEHLCKN